MLNLGVIGYGNRATDVVEKLIKTGEVRVAAVTDIRNGEIKALLDSKGFSDVHFYTDAEELIKNESLDGVLVGTRCSTHTDYALLVAKYDLPLFLEKPVCTNEEDLERLCSILPTMDCKTVVSFPLRLTYIIEKVKEIIDSGKIGEIAHVQATNNVFYGRVYYHRWYKDSKETGGLFLQKATHDLDYINYLLGGLKPVRVCAMTSTQVFKGNEPSGKLCTECDKAETCTESPKNIKKANPKASPGIFCCYTEDMGNEDSGSCLVEYENGLHVCYSQNFIVRFASRIRGARFIGYKGTLEFDWNTNKIRVYRHLENITEDYTMPENNETHWGGDHKLVENFIGVMKGIATPIGSLKDGIASARLCLAAKKSATEHIFVDVNSTSKGE